MPFPARGLVQSAVAERAREVSERDEREFDRIDNTLRRNRRRLGVQGLAALLAVAVPLTFACSSERRPGGADSSGSVPAVGPAASATPCSSGESRDCRVTLGEHNGVLSCYVGTQTCGDGTWSKCGDGSVQSFEGTGVERSVGGLSTHFLALGSPQSCETNPCDPYCNTFPLAPDAGVGAEGSGSGTSPYTWQGGSFRNTPQTLIDKGLSEPCSDSGDCQYNYACVDPQSGTCAHSVCESGAALTEGCDSCADQVCAQDPTCCAEEIPDACEHDPCQRGTALKESCDTCVAAICADEPSCCSVAWTSSCTAKVASVCNLTCGCGAGEETGPDGSCYVRDSGGKSWSDAYSACDGRGDGWHLATITSQTENDFVAGLGLTQDSWIGGTDAALESNWSWVTGESFSFSSWNYGEPGWDDCLSIRDEDGDWAARYCWETRDSICEGPAGTLERCGPGGVYYAADQTCFYQDTTQRSWSDAEAECQSRGSDWHLATVLDAGQDAFLYSTFSYSIDNWIGLSDTASEGDLVWADGTALGAYTNWNGGSPDSDDCGAKRNEEGQWNMRDCGELRPSLCSKVIVDDLATPRTWGESCTELAGQLCGVTCEEPARRTGVCEPWFPGQTDPNCSGIDLGVGVPCDGTIPICNHGQTTAPAGLVVAHLPEDSGDFGSCAPDLSDPSAVLCTTTEAIPPGFCINLTGCTGLEQGREIVVNPANGSEVAECHCDNNWAIYDNAACGAPSCSGNASQATVKPVNMFIQWDKSGSMDGDKWTASTSALKAFFADEGSDGIGVALRFYPSGDCGDACDASACAEADVALGALSSQPLASDPQETALVNLVNSTYPGGYTPTYAALEGATQWGIAGKTSDPTSEWVVILVTDGAPTRCNTDDDDIAALAGSAYAAGVRTYAIGLEGSNESALNKIASQGGTGEAIFISGTNSNSVEQQLIEALQAIAGDAVSCNLDLPNAGSFDPDKATVTYVEGEGPSSGSSGSCAAGQSYFQGRCYELDSALQTWSAGLATCEAKGAGWSLASLTSEEESDFAVGLGLTRNHWIGTSDLATEGTFTWTDGSCFGYSDFYPNGSTEDCVSLRDESDHQWEIGTCDGFARPALCEGPAFTQGACGASEIQGPGDRCYYASSSTANFAAAEADCQSRGSGWHLAGVSDSTENGLVASLIACAPGWIGLTDAATEGSFTWTEGGNDTLSNWSSGEPSGDDCVAMLANGQWEDRSCSDSLPYVCRGPDPAAAASDDTAHELTQVDDVNACGEGWYYDDPGDPASMTLCPLTCTEVQADRGARIEVELGCPDPAGGFAPAVRYQTYEAACPVDTGPQWGFLSYESVTPGDSSITFRVRVGDTPEELQAADFIDVATATSSPDTQSCPMYGPAPCPIDLYGLLGTPSVTRQRLELEIAIDPKTATERPALDSWEVTYSCLPNL